MKKTFLLLLIFLCFSSCDKDELADTNLYGKWEWVSTSGGFAAHIFDTPASTGKSVHLEINKDNSFSFYTDGKLSERGTYYLQDQECIHDHRTKQVIILSTGKKWMIEQLDANQLLLSDENYDGVGSHYKKNERADLYYNY